MITIALSSASHLTQRLECPDVGPVSVLVDRLDRMDRMDRVGVDWLEGRGEGRAGRRVHVRGRHGGQGGVGEGGGTGLV